MSSTYEFPEDIKEACYLAARTTQYPNTEWKNLGPYATSQKLWYNSLIRTRHGHFSIKLVLIKDFSNDSILRKEPKRKNLTSDVVSIMKNISGYYVNWYYLDENRFINIFQVQIIRNYRINEPIEVKVTRYETTRKKCTKISGTLHFVELLEPSGLRTKLPDNFREEDMYKHPITGQPYPPCSVCHNMKVKTKRCDQCAIVYYCGRKCQKKDWKTHKVACKKT